MRCTHHNSKIKINQNESFRKRSYHDFILIGVLSGIGGLLDYIGMVTFPWQIFGASGFYVAVAFFVAFAIWFKWRGLISIYLGMIIGQLMAGTFTILLLILALGNVIGASIPMFFFRYSKLNIDFELKKWRDYIVYIISAVILTNVVSGVLILGTVYMLGLRPYEATIIALYTWIIGDGIILLVIGIPLLKFISPVIKETQVYKLDLRHSS